ncbi:hypothetical protein ACFPRL_21115 [Pseudoclavibacter helvolus]
MASSFFSITVLKASSTFSCARWCVTTCVGPTRRSSRYVTTPCNVLVAVGEGGQSGELLEHIVCETSIEPLGRRAVRQACASLGSRADIWRTHIVPTLRWARSNQLVASTTSCC